MQKEIEIEIAVFHSLGNPKGRTFSNELRSESPCKIDILNISAS